METELIETATTPVATKKKLVRVKPYTRIENLPTLGEGVEIPGGYVPAYFRKRKMLAVLRSTDRTHYLVFDMNTGDQLRVATCSEASATMSEIRRGLKSFA